MSPPTPTQPTAPQTTAQFTPTTTARPVPPLLATTPSGQRTTIITEQPASAPVAQVVGTPVVVTQRPAQQAQTVTHIRLQAQPASNALQRRGLALTVRNVIIY